MNLFGDDAPMEPPVSDLMALWNELTAPPLPRVRELTPKRRKHLGQRLKERPAAVWVEVFTRIQASSFCRGLNERGWLASFDWAIGSPDVAVRTLEGKYDDRKPVTAPDLTCPHTPPCPAPGRWACRQKSDIEAYKQAQPEGASWQKLS